MCVSGFTSGFAWCLLTCVCVCVCPGSHWLYIDEAGAVIYCCWSRANNVFIRGGQRSRPHSADITAYRLDWLHTGQSARFTLHHCMLQTHTDIPPVRNELWNTDSSLVVVYSVSLCLPCCDVVEVSDTNDSFSFDPLLDLWPLIWWICPEKTSSLCILNIWGAEELAGMHFESLSHTFWLFHQLMCLMCRPSNTLTLTVVVTSCCVERRHKVYCPERLFTDVLKMTNFIDLAHAHTHTLKQGQLGGP